MTGHSVQERLRQIPSVENLLQLTTIQEALVRHPRRLMLASIRHVLEEKRKLLLEEPESAQMINLESAHLVQLVLESLKKAEAHPAIRHQCNGRHRPYQPWRSLIAEEASARLQLLAGTTITLSTIW